MKKKKTNRKIGIRFNLPEKTKRYLEGLIIFLLSVIVVLSVFDQAGIAGEMILKTLNLLIGRTLFLLPLILVLGGLVFFITPYEKFGKAVILAALLLILGVSGSLEVLNPASLEGGYFGYLARPVFNLFGFWVTEIIFWSTILAGFLIFWQLLKLPARKEIEKPSFALAKEGKPPSLFKKLFLPKFKVKEISPFSPEIQKPVEVKSQTLELKTKEIPQKMPLVAYEPPPLDLLDSDKGTPTAGDIRINSTIIKKTLENFGIPVEMSEINIGPTVTQYTLKPADGIKLSKITTLSNDLSLALASHPIRIEAPIPGKSLVGIEIPNKARTQVRLRDLISNPQFQISPSNLILTLGRDVSGLPVYADLARMPHLLVAGSTGTGKTCAADTLMFTEKGMLTFEELCPLFLNSEINFKIKLVTRDGIETTSKNYNNGICQFYKISTSRGYQIEATAEHPLWAINENGSQGWKAASLIKKGDYVAISRGPFLFGNKIDLSNFKPSEIKAHHRKISFPLKMTPLLSQFLGLLTADGGLSIERKGIHRVVYTQANSHLLRLYKRSIKELFGITRFIEKRGDSNPKNKARQIEVNSKHLKEFLSYLGMDSVRSPQKEMPRAIREAPKEIVVAYLRALFDNDGYVGKNSIELCISSKKLAFQAHLVLLNFGIVCSLLSKKVKKYPDNNYYRLSILGEEMRKFIQEIGFIRKEKYNKTKEFLKLSPNPNVDLIPHISSLLTQATAKGEKENLFSLLKDLGQKYLNRLPSFLWKRRLRRDLSLRFARLTRRRELRSLLHLGFCLGNRGWRYQSGVLVPKYAFTSLRSYNSGFRAPGYQSLEKILDFYQPISEEFEYQELMEISKRNFYWDKIEKIERTSGIGYDFYVPGSDSFVGNGFVNHNTIFLNSLILSLLYRNSPAILRFILIDPKRVEFPVYNDLPHLLCPVIFDAQKTINALKWLVSEMERRFGILSAEKARDISGYNETMNRDGRELLPFIIVIVDELADLMAARGREVEAGIVRLAQMARAVGIHLVVATQRPSVEVITGLIKANITSRVTFQVASQIDSRTVFDMAGAEKLLGLGDLLFLSAEIVKPKRIQGPYVSEKEVKRVVNWLNSKVKISDFKIGEDILKQNQLSENLRGAIESTDFEAPSNFEEDPLYEEAKRMVIEARKASASLLQRRLRIGYARAARLIDILEERGVVGPGEGAKPREVYFKTEEEDNGWQKV